MSLRWDLETKEGWREYAAAPEPRPPERWTRARYDAASPAEREAYDDERRRHHSAHWPVLHERAQLVLAQMRRQLVLNGYATRLPLMALALDGDSTLGKTTLLRMLGWLHERQHTGAPGAVEPGNDHCPVVNISLESDANVVSINESILRFLGAPLPPRGRQRDLNEPVKHAVRAAGVSLINVDELNFLKNRYVRHQVANDHLKWLMNQLPVTFAFAGIDLTRSSLVAAKQTSWRVKWFRVEPFTLADDAGRREWQALLIDIERHFVLLDAQPRMLSASAATRAYLHRRSQGSIGTLLDLLRNAAEEAMSTGYERIDIQMLDAIGAVHGATEASLYAAGEQPTSSPARKSASTRAPSGPRRSGALAA